MHPRQLTGLPGDFLAGVGLNVYSAARAVVFLVAGIALATASFAASNVIQYTYL